jgi:hypothetical protein
MQLTTRDAEAIFGKLKITPLPSTHHVRGYLIVDEKRVLSLFYSRGRKPFPGNTTHKFRRSMHLSMPELATFRACDMSRDDYIALLKAREVL